jgi:hypothetical protein
MNLARQQRMLLSLLRGSYNAGPGDDPYILKVARSRDLAEARRNVLMWRVYVLERTCALTFALLKQRDLLDEALTEFIKRHNISPFRETQGPMFLEALREHPDPLVASVSQFELALMRVRQGDSGSYVIPWTVEPSTVLHKLARSLPLSQNLHEGTYQIRVSRDLAHQFEILAPNL